MWMPNGCPFCKDGSQLPKRSYKHGKYLLLVSGVLLDAKHGVQDTYKIQCNFPKLTFTDMGRDSQYNIDLKYQIINRIILFLKIKYLYA